MSGLISRLIRYYTSFSTNRLIKYAVGAIVTICTFNPLLIPAISFISSDSNGNGYWSLVITYYQDNLTADIISGIGLLAICFLVYLHFQSKNFIKGNCMPTNKVNMKSKIKGNNNTVTQTINLNR